MPAAPRESERWRSTCDYEIPAGNFVESARYRNAIKRNLAELQWAILSRTTLVGIERIGRVHSLFLHTVYTGLFNDYVSHCIKVFERSSRATSFWYIYRTNKKPIDAFARANNIDIGTLESVTQRLKLIRNKTHFHIDADGVLDTKAIWRQANLAGKELGLAVDAAWQVLKHLQETLGLSDVSLPAYTIADAKRAAECAQGKEKD